MAPAANCVYRQSKAMIRSIAVPLEGKLAAESIKHASHAANPSLPIGFDRGLAWELANLVRIAYSDYTRYDQQQELANLIQIGDRLWLPTEASGTTIDRFWLSSAGEDPSKDPATAAQLDEATAYTVIDVLTYLAFNAGVPPKPEVDRFGFILQRVLADGSQEIRLIFRGTMEPSEWFNDFQYKQIPFLQTDDGDQRAIGATCLGFNKVYTDHRPALAMNTKTLNKYARTLDAAVRKAALQRHPEISKEHIASMHSKVEQALSKLLQEAQGGVSIQVSGHSLGAALATIAALHAALVCDRHQAGCEISLYTFASPRVGDSSFASACNQRLRSFRIANSEDLVPGLPPATLRVIGDEMNPSAHVDHTRKILASLTGGVSDDIFEHVGVPVAFTAQLGEISSNHNMGFTYCLPLRETPASGE